MSIYIYINNEETNFLYHFYFDQAKLYTKTEEMNFWPLNQDSYYEYKAKQHHCWPRNQVGYQRWIAVKNFENQYPYKCRYCQVRFERNGETNFHQVQNHYNEIYKDSFFQ